MWQKQNSRGFPCIFPVNQGILLGGSFAPDSALLQAVMATAIHHNPNPKYKPIEIPAEPEEGAIQVIGRVVKLWKKG